MGKDAVCGMTVDEKKTKLTAKYNGKTYYFCSEQCLMTFKNSPQKFAG